jgi:hypothetical protein
MEGQGAYNRYAKLQAGGATLGLPHLEKAVRRLPLESGDRPIVIADYGSSQGKNSLAPIRIAIVALRARLGPNRPILVYHEDLPFNDFNALFGVLDQDPDRYVLDEPNVFPCAIGRSFYGSLLPPDYVNRGWSSYAVNWASRIPSLIPGHIFALRATGAVRAAFDRQGAEDWETFLSFRANELRPGGRLIVVLAATDDDGISRVEDIMDHANAVLADMVEEHVISADERARMVLGAWPRRRHDLLVPFAHDKQFQDLRVEYCETSALPDTAWADYQQNGSKDALASKHALFFRSTFAPSLALALNRSRDAEEQRAFSDRLEHGLPSRIVGQPAPMNSFLATIVLAKLGIV